MSAKEFSEVIDEILREDPRYAKNAYYFVRKALDYTVQKMAAKNKRTVGHISGAQLSEGFRVFALEQFGPLAATVLSSWGVRETEDIGHIVFNLVNFGVLGKNEKDSIADFRKVYKFSDAFEKPFLTKKRRTTKPRPAESNE